MKRAQSSLLLVSLLGTTLVFAQNNIPQVQHVIVVIQENRTPTNLFHEDVTLAARGAHVVPPGDQGFCHNTPIPLTPQPLAFCANPSHSHKAWKQTCDADPITGQCKMDGACDIGVSYDCDGSNPPNPPYTYVSDPAILGPYFQIAENYGFANWMFQTNRGPSFPAHLFLFSGTSAPVYYNDPKDTNRYWEWFVAENPMPGGTGTKGCVAPHGQYALELDPEDTSERRGYNDGYPCYDHKTMANLLDDAGVSWRYYAADTGFHIWDAPIAFKSICNPTHNFLSPSFPDGRCTGYDWIHNVYTGNPGQVLTDIGDCNLPQVTWVIPDGTWSDHPGLGSLDAGPSWIAAIVNAVGQSNQCDNNSGYWNNTVILITWDDWGGFYDDIASPCLSPTCGGYPNQTGQQYTYGFRVPLLVVSAYAKPAYISGTTEQGGEVQPYIHDFGSMLNFIEYVFGQNGQPLGDPGGISGMDYPYADYFAPDGPNNSQCQNCLYSLADFFTFEQPRPFIPITGAQYSSSCFTKPKSCFSNYPEDPDDDATE